MCPWHSNAHGTFAWSTDTTCTHLIRPIFHSSLLDNDCSLKWTAGSLIISTLNLCAPLVVSYYLITCPTTSLSPCLSVNNDVGSSPSIGSPVIQWMRAAYMDTLGSNHKYPPCTQRKIILTQYVIFIPRPKCGISRRLIILDVSRPNAHCWNCNSGG